MAHFFLFSLQDSAYRFQSPDLISMEQLPFNNGNGQSYGYIVYRKKVSGLHQGSTLQIRGHIRDLLQVMVNGKMVNAPILNVADLARFGAWTKM